MMMTHVTFSYRSFFFLHPTKNLSEDDEELNDALLQSDEEEEPER